MNKPLPYAGYDPAENKFPSQHDLNLFRFGFDTLNISQRRPKDTEAKVLKRLTIQRSRDLGLPNPYESEGE